MRVEPRSCDQDRSQTNSFNFSVTWPTKSIVVFQPKNITLFYDLRKDLRYHVSKNKK